MQIAKGLNNLGTPLAASSAKKAGEGTSASSTQKSEAGAFEKILGQSDQFKRSATPDKEAQDLEVPAEQDSDAQTESLSLETPIQQTLPQNIPPLPQTQPVLKTTNVVTQMPVAPTETVEAKDDTLTRRVAWNDFLGKMNALGVTAEKVVKAFSSLTPDELRKPPEQMVDKLVMALGLNSVQAQEAKKVFNELLVKTRPESFAQDTRLGMLGQVDQHRRQTRESLDNMNRDFFRNPHPKPEKAPEAGPIATADEKPVVASTEKVEPQVEARPLLPFAKTPEVAPKVQAAAPAINKLVEKMQPVKSEDAQALQDILKDAPKQLARAQMAMPTVAAPIAQPQVSAPAVPLATPTPALNALLTKLNITPGKGDTSSDKDDTQTDVGGQTLDNDLTSALGQANGKNEFQGKLTDAQVTAPAQNASPVMTMPELVQQAQVMLRDGGGDMKVTLKQDGLGEVAMKVSVDSGKVNVQMITQTDEAKKLLEHQLGDLKAGLSHNNLQVESIKIDTSGNLQTQLEQQYRDAHRQQVQAQWEQFRQDTGGWKRGYFDTASLGGVYPGQGRGPRDVQAPVAQAQSSRRLNLVA